ncbi:MAG: low specificity L-threonine aldolase [Bradyrhizobiaceae bacterium]|nr:low specificity L-threonine aldolase [Bradyrhizobiaceae bacterium]
MEFDSDNAAGAAPAILDAVVRANAGHATAYGDDAITRRLERRFCELFEREVAVFLAGTGTAANALALAHLTPPWGAVLCHSEAHVIVHECGAPEFFGGGLRLVGVDGDGGKLQTAAVASALDRHFGLRPHQICPAALSLTQANESGLVYRIDEIAALAALAHDRGLAVHMDGARFGNAVARLGVTPAEASWRCGVDVLSFGATKGGALAAEAIVVFDPARADALAERRKRGGHLISKHRFVAAQFEAYLADGLWLRLAAHANRMAGRLATTLAAAGLKPLWPVDANIVFVLLPLALHERLQVAGARYYVIHTHGSDPAMVPAGFVLARFVTSFATTEARVDDFGAVVGAGDERPETSTRP